MRLGKGKPASCALCCNRRLLPPIVLVLLNRKDRLHLCGIAQKCEMTFDDHAFPQATHSGPNTRPFDRYQRPLGPT